MRILYKCPKYDEKKRMEEQTQYYYDNSKELNIQSYTCPECTGGIRVRWGKGKVDHPCAIVIDETRIDWRKNRRFLVSLFKAVKRQKKKDERRARRWTSS